MGCRLWGRTESDTTEGLSIAGWPQASWCTVGLQWGPCHVGSNGSRPPGCPPTAGPHRCPGHSPAHPPRPPGTARPPRLSSPSGAETGRTDERPARVSWGSEGGAGTGWGRPTDRKGVTGAALGVRPAGAVGLTRARARPMVPVPQHTSSTVLPVSSWAQSWMSV